MGTEKEVKTNRVLIKVLWCIVAILSAVITICATSIYKLNSRYSIPYEKESELKYWECKSNLTDQVQDYIYQIAPYSALRAFELVDLCEQYQVDLKFVLAQGELESHFGTKGLAAKTNSVWNLGAFDELTETQINKKYRYDHPNQSIEPYLKLLNDRYLVGKHELDLMKSFVDVSGNRYASDTHYEDRLLAKYKLIMDSTDIDSLQQVLNYYKVMSNR